MIASGAAAGAGSLLRSAAQARRNAIVASCQALVQIPSLPGDERRAAERVLDEMRRARFTHVEIDTWGNVVGTLAANAPEKLPGAILLNAHLDHVDAGNSADWTFGPFSGHEADGRIHGRGSTDTKSAVIAQVHAASLLRELGDSMGLERTRDLIVAAVVQEEVGGLGSAGLIESGHSFHAAVIGEPSQNALAFGHRGRVEIEVTFHGRAAHASRPDWGDNPHPSLARFIPLLDELLHDVDPAFGPSTVAPTLVHAQPASPNVIPSDLVLTLDWRNVSGESPEIIRERIEAIAEKSGAPGISIRVRTPTRLLTSWTGEAREMERVSRPFTIDRNGATFLSAHRALSTGLGRDVPVIPWDFASDGGWLASRGIPCVGFGPGDMRSMHVVDESVSIDLLVEAAAGYALLALGLAAAPGATRGAAA